MRLSLLAHTSNCVCLATKQVSCNPLSIWWHRWLQGRTALEAAMYWKKQEVVNILLDHQVRFTSSPVPFLIITSSKLSDSRLHADYTAPLYAANYWATRSRISMHECQKQIISSLSQASDQRGPSLPAMRHAMGAAQHHCSCQIVCQ